MHDSSWFGLRLAPLVVGLATLVAVSGCVKNDDSCGGPTSDFPFCGGDGTGVMDDPNPPAAGPYGKGDNVDVDGDGKTDGIAVDSNDDGAVDGVDTNGDGVADLPLPGAMDGGLSDGAAGDGGTAEAGTGGCGVLQCAGASTPLKVKGQSPDGPVTVEAVELIYRAGLVYSTDLRFELGRGRLLRVSLPGSTGDLASPVAPVGEYVSDATDAGWPIQFAFGDCMREVNVAATLEVLEHREVSLKQGGSGVLRGELRLDGAGWDLMIPFEIRQACARGVDL